MAIFLKLSSFIGFPPLWFGLGASYPKSALRVTYVLAHQGNRCAGTWQLTVKVSFFYSSQTFSLLLFTLSTCILILRLRKLRCTLIQEDGFLTSARTSPKAWGQTAFRRISGVRPQPPHGKVSFDKDGPIKEEMCLFVPKKEFRATNAKASFIADLFFPQSEIDLRENDPAPFLQYL